METLIGIGYALLIICIWILKNKIEWLTEIIEMQDTYNHAVHDVLEENADFVSQLAKVLENHLRMEKETLESLSEIKGE